MKADDELRVHRNVDAMWITIDREMLSFPNGECLIRSHGLKSNLELKRKVERENPDSEVRVWMLYQLVP